MHGRISTELENTRRLNHVDSQVLINQQPTKVSGATAGSLGLLRLVLGVWGKKSTDKGGGHWPKPGMSSVHSERDIAVNKRTSDQ